MQNERGKTSTNSQLSVCSIQYFISVFQLFSKELVRDKSALELGYKNRWEYN